MDLQMWIINISLMDITGYHRLHYTPRVKERMDTTEMKTLTTVWPFI